MAAKVHSSPGEEGSVVPGICSERTLKGGKTERERERAIEASFRHGKINLSV